MKGLTMTKRRRVNKADGGEFTRTRPVPEDQVQQFSEEAESLSPKRIMDGVATKTQVLNGILARDSSQVRHWGINE